jgi:hypothetical protein
MPERTRDEILRAADRWLTKGCEPTLDELLADPIIRMLMARDGVSEAAIRQLADKIQNGIRARPR